MTEQQVPAFTVISTQDTNVPGENGLMVAGKRVNAVFADGSHTMVEVPYVPGWSDHAKELLDAQLEEHQAIMSHQGPMIPAPRRRSGMTTGAR